MAFTSTQTGIERGGTQLLFPAPPILGLRHQQSCVTRTIGYSIVGNALLTEWDTDENEPLILVSLVHLTAAQVATLNGLEEASGACTLKVDPTSSATISVMWAPREMQSYEPIIGHYPEGTAGGAALSTLLTPWRADLTFVRL